MYTKSKPHPKILKEPRMLTFTQILSITIYCYTNSYTQAERAHPGLCQDFIAGVLDAEGVSINLPEALLRLACHDYQQYIIDSAEDEFVQLNLRARGVC